MRSGWVKGQRTQGVGYGHEGGRARPGGANGPGRIEVPADAEIGELDLALE